MKQKLFIGATVVLSMRQKLFIVATIVLACFRQQGQSRRSKQAPRNTATPRNKRTLRSARTNRPDACSMMALKRWVESRRSDQSKTSL